MKNSKQAIIVFHAGKRLYHLPMEISGKSPRNFWSNGKRPLLGSLRNHDGDGVVNVDKK